MPFYSIKKAVLRFSVNVSSLSVPQMSVIRIASPSGKTDALNKASRVK